MREAAALMRQYPMVGVLGRIFRHAYPEGGPLFHALENEIDSVGAILAHRAQPGQDIILFPDAFLGPLDGNLVVAGKGFHPVLVVEGTLGKRILVHDWHTNDLAKEMNHLLRPRQAAQVAVDDDSIEAVVYSLSLNVVLHRLNIDRLDYIISFAEKLGATRLELANAQYYGWAYRNRSMLIPTEHQVEAAARIALAARKRLRGAMEILYVLPDYFTNRPKPCMNGWGRRYLTVNPSGFVLPCPTASEIPGLNFESVRQKSLSWIWEASDSFNRFRGTDWMPEPCRSCTQRETDFGGCRCQAALLTGDPSNTDPACEFSPHHRIVHEAVGNAANRSVTDFEFRQNPCASVKRPPSS